MAKNFTSLYNKVLGEMITPQPGTNQNQQPPNTSNPPPNNQQPNQQNADKVKQIADQIAKMKQDDPAITAIEELLKKLNNPNAPTQQPTIPQK
jgi:hypothetical protein